VNEDGEIDAGELAQLPHANELFARTANPFPIRPFIPDVQLRAGEKVSRQRLAEYCQTMRVTPLHIVVHNRTRKAAFRPVPGRETPEQRLFRLLDTDGDGKLSAAELAAAPKLLDRLDVNEDELLSRAELSGPVNPAELLNVDEQRVPILDESRKLLPV